MQNVATVTQSDAEKAFRAAKNQLLTKDGDWISPEAWVLFRKISSNTVLMDMISQALNLSTPQRPFHLPQLKVMLKGLATSPMTDRELIEVATEIAITCTEYAGDTCVPF